MAGVDQIGIYQRGTGSFSQYPEQQPSSLALQGDYNSDFDEYGLLISGSLGAGNYSTAATIRSFFKGPIGYNLNDNTYYGEKFFTIKYTDYSVAELEYTVYRVGADTPSWFFHQIIAWKTYEQTLVDLTTQVRPRIWMNHLLEYDWSNPGDPSLEDCQNNGTVNWSPIPGPINSVSRFFYRTREPQSNHVNQTLSFCSAFGDLSYVENEDEDIIAFPSVFTDTPCYIKGMATLF